MVHTRKRQTNQQNNETVSKYFKVENTVIDTPFVDIDMSIKQLGATFFNKTGLVLAKDLLGKRLVRVLDGKRLSGIIVETESYLGRDDKACHSYSGKQTERTKAMFLPPGTVYIYNIYGMYCCMNISCQGEGCCVLIRALQPEEGSDTIMAKHRSVRRKAGSKALGERDLCSGPSKLCQALGLSKENANCIDMPTSDILFLEESKMRMADSDIVTCTRIGIKSAGEEYASKPWRFYVRNNEHVSVRDKKAE